MVGRQPKFSNEISHGAAAREMKPYATTCKGGMANLNLNNMKSRDSIDKICYEFRQAVARNSVPVTAPKMEENDWFNGTPGWTWKEKDANHSLSILYPKSGNKTSKFPKQPYQYDGHGRSPRLRQQCNQTPYSHHEAPNRQQYYSYSPQETGQHHQGKSAAYSEHNPPHTQHQGARSPQRRPMIQVENQLSPRQADLKGAGVNFSTARKIYDPFLSPVKGLGLINDHLPRRAR
eukprot:CAMPEP_0203799822 /NCGR_PEP_ID=MMETSP0100_2-20121128/10141_1 /ASSEMBLY_ACC=CAM_ASM_000210 /TAXON_ID=96639 /ORGANISM=" , Strain NY0313808BC1" /LENGTH=232 /DNA_ID=CAMNT_0050705769 /DNA_START=184 /DNA_END=878 /DNA_ORIENTATION=-